MDVNLVEGFGTDRQLVQLAKEIQHLEHIVGSVTNFRYIPMGTYNRYLIFGGSSNEDDELVIKLYTGKSSMRNKARKYTLFLKYSHVHERTKIDNCKLERMIHKIQECHQENDITL